MRDGALGALSDHRAETGEDLELQELRVFEAKFLGERLDRRRLRLLADARDAHADVHRRLLASEGVAPVLRTMAASGILSEVLPGTLQFDRLQALCHADAEHYFEGDGP